MTDTPDAQAARSELEATRASYHELLASISEKDWGRKTRNESMTVKELMWHMAWGLGWIARSVDWTKNGRNYNPPSFLVDPARTMMMHLLAWGATPERAAKRYDEGHAAIIEKLEALKPDEWDKEAKVFGEVHTPRHFLHVPVDHFAEHSADIRAVLEGAPA